MADLIDRQAALDALGERPLLSGDCEWEIAARKQYDDDRAAIENVPSAQPERKNGKWIYLDELGVFECSSCGGQMVRNIFHYCPWCGAKMEPCAKRGAPMTVCPMCPDCPDNCPL